MIVLAAGSCGLLALAYQDWRSEVRAAQDYPPEDCPTLGEAVAEAASDLRFTSHLMDHVSETAVLIYEDENGCFQQTSIVVGQTDDVTFEQGEDLIREAGGQEGDPAVIIHTHNYPAGSEYIPGLTGTADQTRAGDRGFAERFAISAIAIDVGPEAPTCAHGFEPVTNREATLCL
jgi:hypothetical protein